MYLASLYAELFSSQNRTIIKKLTILRSDADPEAGVPDVVDTEGVLDDARVLGPEQPQPRLFGAVEVDDGARVHHAPPPQLLVVAAFPMVDHLHGVPQAQHLNGKTVFSKFTLT